MPRMSRITIFIILTVFIRVMNVCGDEKTYTADRDPEGRSVSIQETENQIQHEGIMTGRETEDLYNPLGKIDPFAPSFLKLTQKTDPVAETPLTCERVTPLQAMDLSQYQLKAVLKATSGNRALVVDGSGKGYVVKNNMLIGVNCGRVIDILDDRIIVEEQSRNMLNRIVYKKRALLIKKAI